MKQIGDYIYTINEIHQSVSVWKIKEINGDKYRCKNKRTDKIREFSEGDTNIFDTKEEAMKVIKETKRKKNSFVAIYYLILAAIVVVFLMFKMLNGTF